MGRHRCGPGWIDCCFYRGGYVSHTATPWHVDSSRVKYAINSGDKHIAIVSCYVEQAGDESENEANARLIAAAPDLLEALKTIEIAASFAAIPDQGERAAMDAALNVVRAALAKAEAA
jgi:hypothetical protein